MKWYKRRFFELLDTVEGRNEYLSLNGRLATFIGKYDNREYWYLLTVYL
jgi:hypothetical protein